MNTKICDPTSALVMITCFLALAICLNSSPVRARDDPPNVVIVLADDMGWGDAGCYNPNSKCPTPHIDSLAKAGMRLTDAHAAGAWCTPSRYGLLTGRYAFRTSLAWQRQPVIGEATETIADVLRKNGYRTAIVGKWHLGFEDGPRRDLTMQLRGGPCDRGFDEFFGMAASLDIPDYYWIHDRSVTKPPTIPIADGHSDDWSPVQGRFWRGGLRGADFHMEQALDRIAKEAETRIEKYSSSQQPFLLYVPLTSPHTPWLPGEQYLAHDGAGLYSQFVSHTDAVVGRILDSLKQHGLEDDTLVIFASDNGPVWYKADVKRWGHDSAVGLRGMKGDVWEAGHRVPFIVRWPRHVPAETTYEGLFSFVDVMATLAEITGSPPPQSAVDSISFASVWTGKTREPLRSELVTFQKPIAIREGKWKLILHPGSAGFLSHDRAGASPFLRVKQRRTQPGRSHRRWNWTALQPRGGRGRTPKPMEGTTSDRAPIVESTCEVYRTVTLQRLADRLRPRMPFAS